MLHQLWRIAASQITTKDILALATILFTIAILVLAWWFGQFTLQDFLGLAAFLLSFATLVIVFIQLRLMKRQTSLMESQTDLASKQAEIANTQLDIMRRQDEIMAADRARRARLELAINPQPGDRTVNLHVKNSGNKTAASFYWHFMIPIELMQENQIWLGGNMPQACTENLELQGRVCRHFRGYISEPLFPTRQNFIASFAIQPEAPRGGQPIFWSMISEDGKNPEAEGELNRSFLTID